LFFIEKFLHAALNRAGNLAACQRCPLPRLLYANAGQCPALVVYPRKRNETLTE
jgi:hypothetical protein